MPSSFSRVLPFAWECSSRPPVSVCGTVDRGRGLSGFSRGHGLCAFGIPPSSSRPGVAWGPDLPGPRASALKQALPSACAHNLPRPRFACRGRYGNIDPFPIGCASPLPLRGRLTLRRPTWRRKPWAYGDKDSFPCSRYSCQHSLFQCLQGRSRGPFFGLWNAPLPIACAIPRLRLRA